MRFSTVFISSAVVLAGMSAALAVEKDDMLVARFADSDLSEVEARAFDEELELYARGGAISRLTGGRDNRNPPSYRSASRDPPPRYTVGDEQMAPGHIRAAWNNQRRPTDYSNNHKTPAYTSTQRHRRSYYDDEELVARGGAISRLRGGDRNNGNPPSYHTAAMDPPPRYTVGDEQMAPGHIRAAWNNQRRPTDYSNNHKTPAYTSTSRHRRSFDDLD